MDYTSARTRTKSPRLTFSPLPRPCVWLEQEAKRESFIFSAQYPCSQMGVFSSDHDSSLYLYTQTLWQLRSIQATAYPGNQSDVPFLLDHLIKYFLPSTPCTIIRTSFTVSEARSFSGRQGLSLEALIRLQDFCRLHSKGKLRRPFKERLSTYLIS